MNIFSVLTITSLILLLGCKARVGSDLSDNAKAQVSTDSVQIVMQEVMERSGGMNPYNSQNAAIQSMARFIYEPLAVYRTADPFTEEPTPLLAEKIEFDDAARSLTITLRKGIMFHNLASGFKLSGGKSEDKSFALGNVSRPKTNSHAAYELTADDVEFSLLMAAHLNNHSANTWLRGSNLRVQKIDSHTLKVYWNPNENYTSAKNSNYVISYKILSTLILPKRGMDYEYHFDWSSPSTQHFKTALSKSFLEKTMWGTGPYQFSSRRNGLYMVGAGGSDEYPSAAPSFFLDKNYEYWGAEKEILNPAANLPFASIEIVGNMTVRQEQLVSKNNDTVAIAHMSALNGRSYVQRSQHSAIVSVPLPASHTYYLMFSYAKPMIREGTNICTSRNFRQGISLSLDRSALGNQIAEYSEPAMSFFGVGSYSDDTLLESNLEAGKGALAGAGAIGANGRSDLPYFVPGKYSHFNINYPKFDNSAREIAYGLRKQLADLGFRVSIPDHLSSLATNFQDDWRGDIIIRKVKDERLPDPKVLWHSKGAGNDMSFASPQVDQIIDQIHSELDPSRFYNHYHRLDALLKRELPGIPLVRVKDFAALSSKMQLVGNQNQGVIETLIEVLGW